MNVWALREFMAYLHYVVYLGLQNLEIQGSNLLIYS